MTRLQISYSKFSALAFLIAVLATFIPEQVSFAKTSPVTFERETVTLHQTVGPIMLELEIAQTPQQLKRGLMFRTELADKHGMLFLFDSPHIIGMWMKNTYIPLDMLFLDQTGTIIHIAENATPHSTEIISSQKPAIAVIELPGGSVQKYGIVVGNRIEHGAFIS